MKSYLKATILTLLIAALVYGAASAVFFAVTARRVYALKSQVPFFADLVKTQQWQRLTFELPPIEDAIAKADLGGRAAFWMAAIPYGRQPFLAYRDGIHAAAILTRSLSVSLQKALMASADGKTVDPALFMSAAMTQYPELVAALQSLQSSLQRLQQISPGLIPANNTQEWQALINNATQLQAFVAWIEPYINDIPTLLGSKQPFDILLVLQNPDELRPTGGFIGTFGRLTFDQGRITKFYTDDIYRLPEKSTLTPPAPLQTYLGVTIWSLRDANWSPDFPTSARQIITLYEQASGETGIDLVVAVTPRLVEDFLTMTGPITVDNITFTSENLVDAIQYRVEQEFWHIGLTDADRKKIINDLAQALKNRFFSLSSEQAKQFLAHTERALLERDIQLFATTDSLQHQIRASQWSGETRSTANDYLSVVDANLGALKTDRLVDRTYTYEIKEQSNGTWLASLNLHYKNNAKVIDYRTTRYRTYTRIYVPQGSVLVDASGFMTNDRQPPTAQPSIYTENGKTVIAGFISIEPGQSRSVTIHYTMAPWLAQQLRDKQQYQLVWQKQAGTQAKTYFTLESAKPLYSFAPSTVSYKLENPRRVQASQTLSADLIYTVGLSR